MPFQPLYTESQSVYFADICGTGSCYSAVPCTGVLERIFIVPQADVGTGDNGCTFELDGTALTGASIVLPSSGTSTGVLYSDSGSWAVTEGQILELVSDGTGQGTVPAVVTYTFRKVTAL